jgi:hypothetical protein
VPRPFGLERNSTIALIDAASRTRVTYSELEGWTDEVAAL